MVTESTSRQASTLRAGIAILLAMLLGGLLAFPTGRAARADGPPAGIFIYAISRDGAPIGQQRMEFVNDGDKLRVLSHTELEVTLLGMRLYSFNQQAEEVHAGGKLMSLSSETEDDGTDRKVNINPEGNLLRVEYNGSPRRSVDPKLTTSLFWQQPPLGDTQVIDVLRGKVRDVTLKDLGPEILTVPVGVVETHHIRITGEWQRDLWYDKNGLLIAGELEKDGSKIRQELQQRP